MSSHTLVSLKVLHAKIWFSSFFDQLFVSSDSWVLSLKIEQQWS